MTLPGEGHARVASLLASLQALGAHSLVRLFQRSLRARPDAAGCRDAAVLCDAAWEKLHTGDWRVVAVAWRDAYSLAALLRHACGCEGSLRALDLATLVGGDAFRREVDDALRTAEQPLPKRLRADADACPGAWLLGRPPAGAPVPLPPGAGAGGVLRTHLPSLEAFLQDHLAPAVPLLLTGALDCWPALERWPDARHWLEAAGERTVPVEVGVHYLAEGWRQELMPLRRLMQEHVLASGPERGYLAQHGLLQQVPALRADVATPDYCSLCAGDEPPACNVWLGPAGTVTPLHHDPQHNLLCQVVGRKHVRLYAPGAGGDGALYPHGGRMANSSRVDALAPDAARFPLFAAAPFVDCELAPGDALYIPPRWWHFVTALTSSASVSFWWGPTATDGAA